MKKIEKKASSKVAKLLQKDLDAKALGTVNAAGPFVGGHCLTCGLIAVTHPSIVVGI